MTAPEPSVAGSLRCDPAAPSTFPDRTQDVRVLRRLGPYTMVSRTLRWRMQRHTDTEALHQQLAVSQAQETEEEAEQTEDQLVKTLRNSLEPTKALLLKEKDRSCQLGQRLLEKADRTQQLYEGLLEYMDFRIKAMEMTAAAEVQKLRAQLEVATLQARLQEQMPAGDRGS